MPALRGRPGGHVRAAGEEGAPKSDAGAEPAGGDAAERAPFWEGGLLDGADLHADEQGAEHVQGRLFDSAIVILYGFRHMLLAAPGGCWSQNHRKQ